MLSYQPSLFKATEILTAERFARLIIDDYVVGHIKAVRAAATADERARLKRQLPCIVWQATFDETPSKRGYMGRWRKQSAARLNGLFMLDIDHVDDPAKLFASWWQPVLERLLMDGAPHQNGEAMARWAEERGVLLVHITPSGHGLRIVVKARMDGNLSDNQHRLASLLRVACDEACKDASRLSYCPGFDDILYIKSDELFNYDNQDYDAAFGPQYRAGSSRSASRPAVPSAGAADGPAESTLPPAAPPAVGSIEGAGVGSEPNRQAGDIFGGVKKPYPESYYGARYETLISSWFKLHNGGVEPDTGDRHRVLLKLAGDLRYFCNNQKDHLLSALRQHPMVRGYADEDPTDLANICDSVCQQQLWRGIPRRVAAVLQDTGVELPDAAAGGGAGLAVPVDYGSYWNRLHPLLDSCPLLRDAVADLPDEHKLAGVLAAGAMLGTYLTRTWWEHFDGKFYRLSFLVYIIGSAASGKSFITLLDKLLLAPLKSADRIGREAEAKYREQQKKRKANEQLPDMPHPVVRYCPSSTSNAIFYRRLQDAIDKDVTDPDTQEPLHMHIITVESEIATALRAQVGSWAGKLDLELKSFHNEMAGVDFANADSTNGPMQINWNQVMSGTVESMSRKIQPRNVLDGLVTRLILFMMPGNDYVMLERRHALRDHERECRLRQVGYDLEKVKGEIHVPRLVDFCYAYEEELTRRALIEEDRCLDYFRKRIPVIMMRYAIVRLVLRQLDKATKGEDLEVDESDLEFARLIGDWCLQAQIHMFGQMVMDAQEAEAQAFKPRAMQDATRQKYEQLPSVFTPSDMVACGIVQNATSTSQVASRWQKAGLIKKLERGKYQKTVTKL